MRYYLSLGSNSGDRLANLRRAIDELQASGCTVEAVSGVYETEPWGYEQQRSFYNACVRVRCGLEPSKLLLMVKRIERMMGRLPAPRNTRRVIDIDIVLADVEVDQENLKVPHPRFKEREFVLVPLIEVLPETHELKQEIVSLAASGQTAGRIISRLFDKII